MERDSGTISKRMPYGLVEAKIKPYEAYLKKIIFGIIRTPDRTEEIYLETVQKIYFASDRWGGTNFKAWIARIAVNHAIDTKRKLSAEDGWLSLDALDAERFPAPNASAIETEIIAEETVSEIQRLIDGLEDRYRIPLELYYRSDRSFREIAETLGLSQRTVETRIYRARLMIREKWRNHNAH